MKEGKAWVEVGGEFPYKELPLCQAELTGQGGLGRSPSRQQGSVPNALYGDARVAGVDESYKKKGLRSE